MKITVKLFATLRVGRGKIFEMQLPENATPQYITDKLGIQDSEVAILLVNGLDGSFDKALAEGDTVALFPPVGGG